MVDMDPQIKAIRLPLRDVEGYVVDLNGAWEEGIKSKRNGNQDLRVAG